MVQRPVDETNHPIKDDPGVEVEVAVPPDQFRCRARAVSGPFGGQRCRKYAIRGGVVCTTHGGSLPTVKRAAQIKLLMAANPAIEKLIEIAFVKKNVDDADRIRAITQILDRAGIVGRMEVDVSIKPWQDAIRQLMSDGKAAEEEATEAAVDLVEGEDFWVDYDSAAGDGDDDGEEPTPSTAKRQTRTRRRQSNPWEGDGDL